jgi:ATP-dependent helicase YprA (DUF1998 family)
MQNASVSASSQHPTSHERQRARSYAVLDKARTKKKNYSSLVMRERLRAKFREKCGKEAYSWQLDVAEAMMLQLDCILLAGTGMGKTIPFMLPLLADRARMAVIVSPLKILQCDMVSVFNRLATSYLSPNSIIIL